LVQSYSEILHHSVCPDYIETPAARRDRGREKASEKERESL